MSNSLWQKLINTTASALECGALRPVATQSYIIPEGGISFQVRLVDSLARKEVATAQQVSSSKERANPFLPYEAELFVEHLSDTHVCLLNKFNVVDHHLLIVTRAFEPQSNWLNLADFTALVEVLQTVDGLGFYNGGEAAGSSQPHKHLQLIPFQAGQGIQDIPIAAVMPSGSSALSKLALPFWHAWEELSVVPWGNQNPVATAQRLMDVYQRIMTALGLSLQNVVPEFPYNLLVTREWMLGVRRSQGGLAGIGVNSLGYAGWLLAKNPEALQQLRSIGPLTLLQKVGLPDPETP
jgi:ATP adenylyltransferase